jgi:hypothetical protein
MATKYICGGEKYELGWEKDDTIALPVTFSGLPKKIEVEGYALSLKTSFHVSLVCIGKIIEKNNLAIPDFIDKIVSDFCEFTQHTDIDLTGYKDEFRFATQDKRRSVVLMCNISNLDKFFDFINNKYGLRLESPPTHVTLYTLAPYPGIFLTDTDDIDQFTKKIEAPVDFKLFSNEKMV